VSGRIGNFPLFLLSKSAYFFSVEINGVTFAASPGSGATYNVDVGPVKLGAAFSFVEALESLLSSGGDEGPYEKISLNPPALEVGYRFSTDIITFGAFTLQDLSIALSFLLPLDGRTAILSFYLSSREKPFLISSGIYGGGGFFGIRARPSGVESVEGSFEFGAVAAVQFGPLTGSARVTAGIYFSCGPQGSTICGFVVAHGQGSIAWFSLTVDLRVQVCSDGHNVEGQASYTVTFEISSFFSVSFGFTASYAFAGGGSGKKTNAQVLQHVAMPSCLPPPSAPPSDCTKHLSRRELEERFQAYQASYGDDPATEESLQCR
jgi:hypothetical protein